MTALTSSLISASLYSESDNSIIIGIGFCGDSFAKLALSADISIHFLASVYYNTICKRYYLFFSSEIGYGFSLLSFI
jgi:hypothetical protein